MISKDNIVAKIINDACEIVFDFAFQAIRILFFVLAPIIIYRTFEGQFLEAYAFINTVTGFDMAAWQTEHRTGWILSWLIGGAVVGCLVEMEYFADEYGNNLVSMIWSIEVRSYHTTGIKITAFRECKPFESPEIAASAGDRTQDAWLDWILLTRTDFFQLYNRTTETNWSTDALMRLQYMYEAAQLIRRGNIDAVKKGMPYSFEEYKNRYEWFQATYPTAVSQSLSYELAIAEKFGSYDSKMARAARIKALSTGNVVNMFGATEPSTTKAKQIDLNPSYSGFGAFAMVILSVAIISIGIVVFV